MPIEERLFPLPKDILYDCLIPFIDDKTWGRIIQGLLELRIYFNSRVRQNLYCVEGEWRRYYIDKRYGNLTLDYFKVENEVYGLFAKYIKWNNIWGTYSFTLLCVDQFLPLYCRLICFYETWIDDSALEWVLYKLVLSDDEHDIILINNALFWFPTTVFIGSEFHSRIETFISKLSVGHMIRFIDRLRGETKELITYNLGKYKL